MVELFKKQLFMQKMQSQTLIGDGAIKLNQAIPGFVDGQTIRDLTGVKGAGLGAPIQVTDNE